jgi:hypothetical protein
MPSFEQEHPFLLGLAKLRKPTKSYRHDYNFGSINEILNTASNPEDDWDERFDGPKPTSDPIDATPWFWYTQYWYNCAHANLCADLNGHEFREIFDYHFNDGDGNYEHVTINTGDWLDRY